MARTENVRAARSEACWSRYLFLQLPRLGQSGGPWIQPEQSMRRVIWNEFESKGGAFKQNVRAKGVPGGGSQDIAVLAVPETQGCFD